MFFPTLQVGGDVFFVGAAVLLASQNQVLNCRLICTDRYNEMTPTTPDTIPIHGTDTLLQMATGCY